MSALPKLIDCKGIQQEMGVTRAAAEKVMRQLKPYTIPGLRKRYVDRGELDALLRKSRAKRPVQEKAA